MGQLCSIYRLAVNRPGEALKPDHDGERLDLRVAGHAAVRVDVERADHPPDWADALATMTGQPYAYEIRSASAVLVVDLGPARYALTFGQAGRYLLNSTAIQPDFGIAIAIRCLDPEQVLKLARTALDLTSRNDLTYLPNGDNVLAFGADQYRDIVKQLEGRTSELKITQVERTGTIGLHGGDALRVRVAKSPDALIADLTAIEDALARDPHPELAFIEGLRPVSQDRHARGVLAAELGKPDSDRIGLAVPTEVDPNEIDSFTVEVEGRKYTADTPRLDVITGAVRDLPEDRRFDAFRSGRVHATLTGRPDPLETPLGSWLAAELSTGDDSYVLHGGRFYRMTDAYRHSLDRRVTDLLARSAGLTLPPWPAGKNEHSYCQTVSQLDGFEMLDRRRATGKVHGHGIEICDLFGPGGELICVKRAEKSSTLSHLFFQAIVAADAIYHTDARQKLAKKLPPRRRGDLPERPHFVLAIQLTGKDALTAQTLFSFSKVALSCAAAHLHRLAMNVSIISIGLK